VLERAGGQKASRGAALLANTAPCRTRTSTIATTTAKRQFEKTQKLLRADYLGTWNDSPIIVGVP